MKICPVGCELFYADRRTDRLNDANSRFSQFYEFACKFTPVSNPSAEKKILKIYETCQIITVLVRLQKLKRGPIKYVSVHSGLCGTN